MGGGGTPGAGTAPPAVSPSTDPVPSGWGQTRGEGVWEMASEVLRLGRGLPPCASSEPPAPVQPPPPLLGGDGPGRWGHVRGLQRHGGAGNSPIHRWVLGVPPSRPSRRQLPPAAPDRAPGPRAPSCRQLRLGGQMTGRRDTSASPTPPPHVPVPTYSGAGVGAESPPLQRLWVGAGPGGAARTGGGQAGWGDAAGPPVTPALTWPSSSSLGRTRVDAGSCPV